jgi:hypothetical protein
MADDDLATLDPQAAAAEALQVAALRTRRSVTHSDLASDVAAAPPPVASREVEEGNPYSQFRADPQDDGIGLLERQRLNRQEAFYRGTLAGSTRLSLLSNIFKTPDEPGVDPDRRRVNDGLRDEYRGVVADLAAHDILRPWDTTLEGAAALSGQLEGSMLSPESWLGWGAEGATWLARTARAGLQQGAIQAAVDPAVQVQNIRAGVQEEYDPLRTATAFGAGAALAGGMHGAGEALGSMIGQALLKRQLRDLAREDSAFVGIVPPGELHPEPTTIPEAAPAEASAIREWKRLKDKLDAGIISEAELAQLDAINKSILAREERTAPETASNAATDGAPAVESTEPASESTASTAAAPVERPPSVPADVPNEIFTGHGRKDRGTAYNAAGSAVPIAGPGRYFSFDREHAATFGPTVDRGSVGEAVQNPLVITDGAQWRSLTREAGWEVPNPFGKSEAETRAMTARLQDVVKAKGHDGLVVWWDDKTSGDVGPKGENIKLLRNVFDQPQVISYREGGAALEGRSAPHNDSLPLVAGSADELALAQRRGGGVLKMERRRPQAGTPNQPTGGGTAVAVVADAPSPAQSVAIRSLQQQAFDLADALGFPLREGRVGVRNALGTFNSRTGVVRVKEAPDFEVVAHEAGHAIEAKAGQPLTQLTEQFRAELAPLVSNASAYDPAHHVREGFAEYIRRMIGNPAHAQQVAPGFTTAFRDFMTRNHPDMLAALDHASEAYRAYLDAPSTDAVGAVRRSVTEDPHGWGKVKQFIADNGFPGAIKSFFQWGYAAILDDKAPVARAVRDLGRAIRDKTDNLVSLKDADNPEVLLRLRARAQQAAVRDMQRGVTPYRGIEPEGPSLADAMAKATGEASVWGRWDPDKKADFSKYLIARRADVLWEKFKAGSLPNPPAAFSHADARVAMADFERANPSFREASDMVHQYTRQMLRKQFDSGLIDADLYRKLLEEKFYVPFMRDMSDKPLADGGNPAGNARNPDGPGTTQTVKRMFGSTRDIKDPIESIMMQTFLVNRTIRHNDVIRSFVGLARRAGIEGGRYVEPVPPKEAVKYTVDISAILEQKARAMGLDPTDAKLLAASVGDMFGEDPLMGSYFKMEQAKKRGEPIVFYKESGTLKAARFMAGKEGHALYETLMAASEPITDLWVDLIRGAAVIKRSGIVTNPTFAISNYVRDQVAASILRSDYVPIASGLPGIVSEVRQGMSAQLYAYAGGVAGGAATGPVERAAEADVNALAKKGYTVNRLTSFKGLLELSSVTEAGTRNSVFGKVFEAKKRQGLSDYEAMIEAAFQAQDLLDFSRHGSHTLVIRQLLPFLNAHIQGLDKAWRTIVEPMVTKLQRDQVFDRESGEFRNAVAAAVKVGALGSALGAVWAAVNWEKEAYRDASPYFKGTHMIVPFGNKIIVVPKPFELGLGFTAGEFAFARLMKDDPRAGGQFLDSAWQALAPPSIITDIPLVSTGIELATGKSLFTNRDIVPGEYQKLKPEDQFNDRTSALAKWLGQATGLSPMKIEYGIGSQFGTWGRDVMALSQGVDQDTPALNMEDQVLLRRFIKDPTRTSDITTRFWNFMGQTTGTYNQDVATYDFLVKGYQDDKAKAFLDQLPAGERAFVTLRSGANEDGKAAFNTDERRLHPLQRAYDAVSVLNGLRKELSGNTFRDFETLTNLKLDPEKRRGLIENIRELAQTEMRNALVILKEPGYATRPVLDVKDTMTKLQALSPEVANEIATRYATGKIYTTASVQQAWPILRDELARHGSEADVADLAMDAKAEGYEFGGDRVKRPQKRRVTIQPNKEIQP